MDIIIARQATQSIWLNISFGQRRVLELVFNVIHFYIS